MQVLNMHVESYFDGRLFKNKIWVGTVEGLELIRFQSENILAFLLCPNTLVGCNFDHIQGFLFISLNLFIQVNSSGGINFMERMMILRDFHTSAGQHLS